MVIVEIGEDTFAVIHKSISNKARYSNCPTNWVSSRLAKTSILKINKKDISNVINQIAIIKNAKMES